MTPSPIFARGFICKSQTPPPTPTNRELIQAYRALAPVELGNARPWKWTRASYAAAQTPGPDYDNQLREGFALKYGDAR